MDPKDSIRLALTAALEKLSGDFKNIEFKLETPADFKNGEYSTNIALKIFSAARRANRSALAEILQRFIPRAWHEKIFGGVVLAKFGRRRNSLELANTIVSLIGSIEGVSKIRAADPGFINFYLSPSVFIDQVQTAARDDMWGSNLDLISKKIMVEYTDPNPFKEFHIGHLMSNAIGESISRLLQFSGAEVKRANYQGDVGPHVAKTIWSWQTSGLNIDSIRDAGPFGYAYAQGTKAYDTDSEAKEQIDIINAKIYDRSDQIVNNIYDKGREVSLKHFESIYKILGTKFDFYFFESETAPKGIEIVKAHPDVFTESDGAIVYKGEQDGLHTRVFITSKGLPTYETKELGLAELKDEKWNFDESITVTAHEQADYFAVVLAAMKKVLPNIAPKIRHISHGMMRLPSGKMSSRTGDVITGESLLADVIEQARIRATESRAENHDKLARDIAVGAIKYQILKQASGKDITFDRERALSLDGDSGPYLQYAHARAFSLLQKAHEAEKVLSMKVGSDKDFPEVAGVYLLSRTLNSFPDVVRRAAKEAEPHYIATYLIELTSIFSRWYATQRIIVNGQILSDRVDLIQAIQRTLKNGLWMLGIPAPEKM